MKDRRFAFLFVALFVLVGLSGCQVMKDAYAGLETSIKTPPETVVTAGKMVLDFLLGLFGVAVRAVLHGILPL